MPLGPTRAGVALTQFLPPDDPGGVVDEATLIDTIAAETAPTTPPPHGAQGMNAEVQAAIVLRRSLKGGDINQGYAQCDVDRLQIAIDKGQCSVERIQCRQMAPLKVTALAGLGTVSWTITPVGPAFARELVVAFARPDTAALDFTPVVTQISAKGRFAVTGVTASTVPASNIPVGFPMAAFGGTFQNYVLSSGIIFDSSNPLIVTAVNPGADVGSILAGLTYDLIRAG